MMSDHDHPDTDLTDPHGEAEALRDQIARWNDGGPAAGQDESKALFEALDSALATWEKANDQA